MTILLRLFMFVVLVVTTTAAHSQLAFCNRTNSALFIAISIPTPNNGPRVDKGWFKVAAGECSTLVSGSLKYRYYYYYANRPDGTEWRGDEGDSKSCIHRTDPFEITDSACPSGTTAVPFRRIDTGDARSYTMRLTHNSETIDVSSPAVRDKVCEVLGKNLDRPRLRSERVKLASYTDPLTLPQTRTECTNTYDTGVPDPSTCTTTHDPCAREWRTDFPPARGCIPGLTTRCSNVRACNTWKTEKRVMECDLVFQIKLPNYIEKPISDFVNNSYEVLESARREAATSLPLACAPQVAASDGNVTRAVAEQLTNQLKERIRSTVEREASTLTRKF